MNRYLFPFSFAVLLTFFFFSQAHAAETKTTSPQITTEPIAETEPAEFETIVSDKVFSTSSKVIIDEKTIKKSNAQTVTELLSSQANISVANTPSKQSMIYIRGADSGHILILVDGVPFYDASTSDRTFNLNSLDLKTVRRIEVLKGSQTVLYGGQALGGVIKIETFPNSTDTTTNLKVEGGTQNHLNLSAQQVAKVSEESAIRLTAQTLWEKNQSPVLGSDETYPHQVNNAELSYFWKGSTQGHVKAFFVKDYSRQPLQESNTNYTIVDTPDYEISSDQFAVSSQIKMSESVLKPEFSLGLQKSYRQFYQAISDSNSTLADQDYWSQLRTVRVVVTPYEDQNLSTILGLSYNYEDLVFKYNNIEDANAFSEQRGLFTKVDYAFSNNIKTTAGGRLENWTRHEAYISSYQIGLTLFENTKIEHSTGYKIPSLFQLYSSYGNSDLKQESAIQDQISHDINLNETTTLSTTLFETSFTNLIASQGSPRKYQNVKKAKTKGIEMALNTMFFNSLSVLTTFGYQEPRDLDQDQWLAKRPLRTASVKLNYTFNDATQMQLEAQASSEKVDNNTNTTTTSLPGYAVANAGIIYKTQQNLGVFARISNLLNHRYQESYTYYSAGRKAIVGLEAWF